MIRRVYVRNSTGKERVVKFTFYFRRLVNYIKRHSVVPFIRTPAPTCNWHLPSSAFFSFVFFFLLLIHRIIIIITFAVNTAAVTDARASAVDSA